MELLFGTHVREYGQMVGRLAGFELDPTSHQVLKIIFSGDGELGNQVMMRPFASVMAEPGEIEIHPYTPQDDHASREGVILGRTARILRDGHEEGHVKGVDVTLGSGDLEGVIGRKTWFTRRFRVDGHAIDLTVPGEVRVSGAESHAA